MTHLPTLLPAAVRRTRLLAAALAAAVAFTALPAPAQVRLPALGDSASEDLPVSVERRYGEQVMRELRRDPAFLDDPVLLDYAHSLWRPLLEAARRRGDIGADIDSAFAWELFLVRDRSVNAFALPGGHVGVHLGLVAATATADELASVLAHELSHVTQRHIARSLGNAGRQGAVGIAAMLLGILVASRSQNPDVANAAIAGGQAAMVQGQLNFSRDMEREADRIGFGMLADAGFAPEGMAGMFNRLEQASRLNDSGAFPYLRSHPLTGERMAEARNRLSASTAGRGAGSTAPSRGLHALMQGRSRVLMEPHPQSWQRLVQAGRTPSAAEGSAEHASALYAASLAASRLGDHATAQDLARRLAQGLSRSVELGPSAAAVVALLQAEEAIARGEPAAAAQALGDAASAGAAPWARARLLLKAETALTPPAWPGQPQALLEALEGLQLWVAEHGQDAGAWALLARCADALGLRLRALRAQAEAQALRGDLGAAIDLLRRAQAASRGAAGADLIEASVIDARLRALEARRREQLMEAREQRGSVNRSPHFLPRKGSKATSGTP